MATSRGDDAPALAAVDGAPAPVGVDAEAVTRWLATHLPAAEPPLRFARIAGGRSNLTYRMEDAAGRAWVLRRPPLSGVLASAHDMAREHRVLSALGQTGFPVPPVRALCVEPDVNGAPFYVMDFVDGLVLATQEDAAALGPEQRAEAGRSLVETLARLHGIDPGAVGLDGFGRPAGYVERQIRRWGLQWAALDNRAEDARVRRIAERLAATIPAQPAACVVHGDFRLDNAIVGADGRVRAVVDWELATLGDPRADLGLLCVYWSRPGDHVMPLGSCASLLDGFQEREELLALYAGVRGEVRDLEFFVAFAQWKLAVVLQGVHDRARAGAYGDRADVDEFPAIIRGLLDEADAATAAR